jgi:hypothetical protein
MEEITAAQLLAAIAEGGYFNIGIAIVEMALQLAGIPDPLDIILSQFSGRPKMDATIDEAKIFSGYTSPVLKLLGVGAADCVNRNIPLSSPDAAPWFGPYFEAAVKIENVIRWNSQDASAASVDAATLATAMHEAGNPSQGPPVTLTAVQSAYSSFLAAQRAGSTEYTNQILALKNQDPAGSSVAIQQGWASNMVEQFPQNATPPGQPGKGPPGKGPGTGPGGSKPPPPPPSPVTLTLSVTDGQKLSGYITLFGEYHGYPGPDPVFQWEIDSTLEPYGAFYPWNTAEVSNGEHAVRLNLLSHGAIVATDRILVDVQNGDTGGQEPGTGPAGLRCNLQPGETIGQTYGLIGTWNTSAYPDAHIQWLIDNQNLGTGNQLNLDTTKYENGEHELTVECVGQRGLVHQTLRITFYVANQGNKPPPPPGGSGTPPEQPEFPWQTWFKVCTEPVPCDTLNDGEISYTQGLANIAHAIYDFYLLYQQAQNDDCCGQVVGSLGAINNSLAKVVQSLNSTSDTGRLVSALNTIAHSLNEATAALDRTGPGLTSLGEELTAALAPLKEIASTLADDACCENIVNALKELGNNEVVPEAWIQALIETGALPPQFAGLVQGTTWLQVLSALFGVIVRINKWMYDELEPARDWLFQLLQKIFATVPLVAQEYIPNFNANSSLGAETIAETAALLGVWVNKALTAIVGTAVGEMITLYEADISKIDTSTIAGTNQATEVLLSRSLAFGVAAHCIAFLSEIPFFNKLMGFKELAALVAEYSGFKEVVTQTHRPFLNAAVGRPATYATNREYPTTLPPAQAGFTWYARRLLPSNDATFLAASSGLAEKWINAEYAAAWRPISPRAMVNLLTDQPIDVPKLNLALEDNSYSPANVSFMSAAIQYASTKTLRNSYANEAIQAYQHGVMPDSELDQILENLGWSSDAKYYVIQRAALARRVTLATKVEGQIVPLVAAGSVTPEEGTQQLEAAGIQPWYADLEITLATTKATIAEAKREAAAERKAQLQTQRNLTRASVAEYRVGRLNNETLTAALATLGLEPSLIASILAVEEAAMTGRLRLVYGKMLLPDAAKILTEQVSAIEAQVKAQLISYVDAATQLLNLGIEAPQVHALVADWAASITKSPGPDVRVNPITGIRQ